MKRIFRVHFKDNGQDFLTWDIDLDGNVVACKPFQGFLWEKAKVINVDELEVGGEVRYDMPHILQYDMAIVHPIEDIEAIELPERIQSDDQLDAMRTICTNYPEIKKMTVLRPQHDSRRNNAKQWKIAKKTNSPGGGWARFGGHWYYTKEVAEAAIDRIVSAFPAQFEKEA